jgi:hypothetical protein
MMVWKYFHAPFYGLQASDHLPFPAPLIIVFDLY